MAGFPAREARPRGVLCPFCGEVSPDLKQCRGCRAFLDPLSRQASQNEMGPWFVRDAAHPFRPGCSFETIRKLVKRGSVGPLTVIRGPATRQSWTFAGRCPSVANLLGLCHNCQRDVSPEAFACPACGASFAADTDRQHLGLAPVHLLPGQAEPEAIASAVGPPAVTIRPGARAVVAALPRAPDVGAPAPAPAAPAVPGADVSWLRVRAARWRAAAAVLLILVLALGAAVGAMLLGWRPDRWLAERAGAARGEAPVQVPRAEREPEAEGGPDSTAMLAATGSGAEVEAAAAAPDSGPESMPAAPMTDSGPRAAEGAERPARAEGGEHLGALVALLTREPLDIENVRDAAARLGAGAEWVEAAERRAAALRLRALR